MSTFKAVPDGENVWDLYPANRDGFFGTIRFENVDFERGTCDLIWEPEPGLGFYSEYPTLMAFAAYKAIYQLGLSKLNVAIGLNDLNFQKAVTEVGYQPGREFGQGSARKRRYSCDRYDIVRNHAEYKMSQYLDMRLWSFGWDSAKRRLGVCKYGEHRINLSRYLVDLHSFNDVQQVILHEIAHAMCGPRVGHGKKWRDTATKLGYLHEKISGEEIGNATAKYVGTCPNGHLVYRHRKPKTELSCSRCARGFSRKFLISWETRD